MASNGLDGALSTLKLIDNAEDKLEQCKGRVKKTYMKGYPWS
jgi:hypothetical protein